MIKFICGSCSVETLEESLKQAKFLYEHNIDIMRFMLWKPRTKPNSYQGIGEEGISQMYEIKNKYPEIKFVVEIMGIKHLEILESLDLDIYYQIGARNCQNYFLLKGLGERENNTIIFKRGFATDIDEYINAAEYMNPDKNNIWMCLRGIRTFDLSMRNTPDIGTLIALKSLFEYTNKYLIGFDPSHVAGDRKFIYTLSKSAIAAGSDFLEIEIHSNPDNAKSDSKQTISFNEMEKILKLMEN